MPLLPAAISRTAGRTASRWTRAAALLPWSIRSSSPTAAGDGRFVSGTACARRQRGEDSMRMTTPDVLSFWCTPWSETLRAACVWTARFGPPISGQQPDKAAPRWLRPLCLQRWVGQAIAARLAWMRAHPEAAAYRYGSESEPCWQAVAWVSYDW